MGDQQSLRSACAYAQSDQRLCLSLEYSMTVKLLAEDNLESLNLKGDCTGWYESTLGKMSHCWKSHVVAHMESKSISDVTSTCRHLSCILEMLWRIAALGICCHSSRSATLSYQAKAKPGTELPYFCTCDYFG